MAIEVRAPYPSFLGPSGAAALVRTQVRTFTGTIARGSFRSIASLVGLNSGETILIQHIPGTGLIRLGQSLIPPPIYEDTFEYPRIVGPLVGQDGWVNLLPPVGLYVPKIIADATMGGVNSLNLPCVDNAFAGDNYALVRPLTVPPLSLLTYSFDVTIDTSVGTGGNLVQFGPDTMSWSFVQTNANNALFFGGLGNYTVSRGVKHRITSSFDSAGTPVAVTIDGVAQVFGVAPLGLPTQMIAFQSGDAAFPSIARIDNYSLIRTLALTSGLLILDGAGERLEAQTIPMDLSQIAIGVDAAAVADAQVEIFVIGN